jgi:hypothetical protein
MRAAIHASTNAQFVREVEWNVAMQAANVRYLHTGSPGSLFVMVAPNPTIEPEDYSPGEDNDDGGIQQITAVPGTEDRQGADYDKRQDEEAKKQTHVTEI